MEDSVLFRNVETHTLKWDRLLTKLRKQVDEFIKGRLEFAEIKDTLKRLKKSRNIIIQSFKEVNAQQVSSEYVEPLRALLEFTILVLVNDERELISSLLTDLENKGYRTEAEYLKKELTELEEFFRRTSDFLNKVPQTN